MYQGSCLCGAVHFEIHGAIRNIIHCHCSQCRKAQGSAFATNGIVKRNEFKITAGEDQLTRHRFTKEQSRYFCRHCGSPIMSRNTTRPDEVRVRIGTIESDIEERPMAHIFTTSKANWEDICGDLPQHESYEPDRKALEICLFRAHLLATVRTTPRASFV